MIFLFLVNTLNALVVANVVPKGQMELNNIAQSISIYCQILGLPHIIVNIFSLLVFVGVAVQLSAWASGPAKTVTASARKGADPPKFNFWKTNQLDCSDCDQPCLIFCTFGYRKNQKTIMGARSN